MRSLSRSHLRHAIALILILGAALALRARDLAGTPTSGDEAESAINALTIAQRGVPCGEYLGLPIYENVLVEPWPEHSEYEFRDSSYSKHGLVIYHGWLPLYSMWASQQLYGVTPDQVSPELRVRHSPEEVRRRVIAARAPSIVFGMVFLLFLFVLAHEMFGIDAAYAALVVGAFGRPFVYMAREARYHAATMALSTACCWAIWRVYRYGRWADYLGASVLLTLLFYTHLLAFAIASAMFGAVALLRLLRSGSNFMRTVVAVVIVAALTAPWILLSGLLDQTVHLPPARAFLSFPKDLFWYPVLHIPYLLLPLACALWLAFVFMWQDRLPPRVTAPLKSHRAEITYLLVWIGLGILAFTLLVPAASYFYKRLALAAMGAGVVWGAILFAAAARAVAPRRAIVLAPAAFLAAVVVSNVSHLWFLERPDRLDTYVAIDHLRKTRIEPDTKLYCTPNHQLALTYLAGLPVQSVAPVRKAFLDSYRGPILLIDSATPHGVLWPEDVLELAKKHGQPMTRAEAEVKARSLSTHVVREALQGKVARVDPPLEPLTPFDQHVVRFLRQRTEQELDRFYRHGGNNPLLRAHRMRDWSDWWPIFFYAMVEPPARMGDRLNYAERVRRARAEVLPSTWVLYHCPPPDAPPLVDRSTLTMDE